VYLIIAWDSTSIIVQRIAYGQNVQYYVVLSI
jgi:hypothetical protein